MRYTYRYTVREILYFSEPPHYDRFKMASIEVKEISSLCKTHMHVTVSVYEKCANLCLRIYM